VITVVEYSSQKSEFREKTSFIYAPVRQAGANAFRFTKGPVRGIIAAVRAVVNKEELSV
jgi:hypothetical protein